MDMLLDSLRKVGWTIRATDSERQHLPVEVQERYRQLPEEVLSFVASLCEGHSADDTSWFTTFNDPRHQSEHEFEWNECERIDIDSCETSQQIAEAKRFWDAHFPLMLAVHSSYDYIAVCLNSDGFGSIVHGQAGDSEAPTNVAENFYEFCLELSNQAKTRNPRFPYSLFVRPEA